MKYLNSTKINSPPWASSKSGRCYGCASAAVEHCTTLLRALVTQPAMRQMLVNQVSSLSVSHASQLVVVSLQQSNSPHSCQDKA